MRLLIVGAGATGGYFGGRLTQAGRDVTFLVRDRRAAHLRETGLRITSPFHGDATVTPRLLATGAIDGPYDAIILAVKAYALDGAMEDVAPAVGGDTMVMPLLNGMRHMEALTARFGAGAVIGGVCRVATMLDAEGGIRQLAPFQELLYGERDGRPSERTAALDRMLSGAGFDAVLTPAIERAMWEKWLLLASMGGICCLMRASIGEIEAAPGGVAFVNGFIDEVVAVIRAAGEAPSEAAIANCRTMLTTKGSPMASSMYRDMQQAAPIEAEQIIGDLLARGAAAGVATPLLAAANVGLSVYRPG